MFRRKVDGRGRDRRGPDGGDASGGRAAPAAGRSAKPTACSAGFAPGILMTLVHSCATTRIRTSVRSARRSPGICCACTGYQNIVAGRETRLWRLTAPRSGIGERVRRNEDARLLTGRALFVDDVRLEGCCTSVSRQPVSPRPPHERRRSAARGRPGVVAYTPRRTWGDFGAPVRCSCRPLDRRSLSSTRAPRSRSPRQAPPVGRAHRGMGRGGEPLSGRGRAGRRRGGGGPPSRRGGPRGRARPGSPRVHDQLPSNSSAHAYSGKGLGAGQSPRPCGHSSGGSATIAVHRPRRNRVVAAQ